MCVKSKFGAFCFTRLELQQTQIANNNKVMKKTLTALIGVATLGILSVNAGETYHQSSKQVDKNPPMPPAAVPCFAAGEVQLDAFAGYVDPKMGDAGAGVGVNLNYFVTEMLGLGVGALWYDPGTVVHNAYANVILRYPFQDVCVAPYVYGGGGGHWDSQAMWTAHIGVGVEYRVTPNVGVFADARYTWADEDEGQFWMLGGGIRLAF